MFPRHRRPLMVCVILPALGAPLVSRIRQPAERSLLELAASLVAVALAPVIRPTDVEPDATSVAVQREDNELVHPARTDENWTATSASSTVPAYWLSIRRLYTRVQAATWTLLRSPPFGATGSLRAARVPGVSPPAQEGTTSTGAHGPTYWPPAGGPPGRSRGRRHRAQRAHPRRHRQPVTSCARAQTLRGRPPSTNADAPRARPTHRVTPW